MNSKSDKIELLHASDPRSEIIEINKIVYEIELDTVAYEIARCENRMRSIFVKNCMKSESDKIDMIFSYKTYGKKSDKIDIIFFTKLMEKKTYKNRLFFMQNL